MSARLTSRSVTVVVTPTPGLDDAASRAALLIAAAQVSGVAPRALRLRHDSRGRPLLSGLGDGLWVSLSHGRGVAALALSDVGPVGVDVEVPRPVAARRLAERWFSAAEAEWVGARPEAERDLAFFWLWTHKEAMGKAYGTGLGAGGLTRPGPLPRRWPPVPGPRLRPLLPHAAPAPGARPAAAPPAGLCAVPAVAAPVAGPRTVLAVAALGRRAWGAPVDIRLCPTPPTAADAGRYARGTAGMAPPRHAEHPTNRREPTT